MTRQSPPLSSGAASNHPFETIARRPTSRAARRSDSPTSGERRGVLPKPSRSRTDAAEKRLQVGARGRSSWRIDAPVCNAPWSVGFGEVRGSDSVVSQGRSGEHVTPHIRDGSQAHRCPLTIERRPEQSVETRGVTRPALECRRSAASYRPAAAATPAADGVAMAARSVRTRRTRRGCRLLGD